MSDTHETLYETVPQTKPRTGSQDCAQVVTAWSTPGGVEVMVGWSAYTHAQARALAGAILAAADAAQAHEIEHGRKCPDGGTCHHLESCQDGSCFRVKCCGPLSGKYPADVWPERVREAYGAERRTYVVLYENPAMRDRAQEHEVQAWDSLDAIWETARWLGTKFPKVMEGARILTVRRDSPLKDSRA